ncbi:HAD family phosphatase [Streptomyces sp. NPDC006733]|uniref:HAD family hydrolase n=1 Tax=Streptomyces sp. NPDC006733 TaxID=3155460 RepID=UPI00340F8AAE
MNSASLLSWTPVAVVFDCDGTLMDTEKHWQDARVRALAEIGFTPTAEFAEQAKGLHYTECGQMLATLAGRPDLGERMTQRLLEHFQALVADRPMTMPGAVELVEALAGSMPLAVASNCPMEVVESCLDTAGLLQHFGHIVVPDGPVRPKPHPDVYLQAARLCATEPSDILAIEDSHCGVLAAQRAGMRVLGTGPRPADATAALTDLWVDSLDDPRVQQWAHTRIPALATR